MNFFRTDVTTPPIEELLNKLEGQPIKYSPPDFPPPSISALRQFLEEEDVLRECRADNKRLINYLARPEIVMDLVRTTFDLPPLVGPARPDATGSQKSATSVETPVPCQEQRKEHHLKHAHVASELITSDNKRLSEAIVSDDRVLDKVISYLEIAQAGNLHNVVALYFAKLMVSLLKTHNTLTIQQMAKRGQRFILTLLRHIDSAPISELVVSILDSPDMDHVYNAVPTNKRPTPEALALLVNADIFGALADCFVRASADGFESALADSADGPVRSNHVTNCVTNAPGTQSDALLGKHPLETSSSERPKQKPRSTDDDPASSSTTALSDAGKPALKNDCEPPDERTQNGPADADANVMMKDDSSGDESAVASTESSPLSLPDAESMEEVHARRRRLREETMWNVTCTMLGLTERMLQLPELGCPIPDRLSVFASPVVVSRLLDAGIYARCNGAVESSGGTDGHADRVEAFSNGSNSALMHALGLVANLLSTESNVFRDDEEEGGADAHGHDSGIPSGAQFRGRSGVYSGKGIGGSVTVDSASASKTEETETAADKEPPAPRWHEGKKDGDKIVSTAQLEVELSARFERLALMFEEGESVGTSSPSSSSTAMVDGVSEGVTRPLGSLRLKLAEFFVACLQQTGQDTVDLIVKLEVPKTLLRLFDRYRWSSMLHGVVTNAIISCLCGGEVKRPGRMAWFDAGLMPWVIDVWSRNGGDEGSPRWGRCGYMGHLIRIGTTLKGYILDVEVDDSAGVPDRREMERFKEFGEAVLMPAHHREALPLCEDGGGGSGAGDVDEGEEATDILEMGGIHFVDGLSEAADGTLQMKYAVLKVGGDVDDEGEIKPVDTVFEDDIKTVDVEDLEQIGGSDVIETVSRLEDHDIPPEIRERLASVADAGRGSSRSSRVDSSRVDTSVMAESSAGNASGAVGFQPAAEAEKKEGFLESTRTKVSTTESNGTSLETSGFGARRNNGHVVANDVMKIAHEIDTSNTQMTESREVDGGSLPNMEDAGTAEVNKTSSEDVVLTSVMDSADSSSEDEGSYEAFVDDRKERRGGASSSGASSSSSGGAARSGIDDSGLASQVEEKLKVDDGVAVAPSASLDGVVTEIEEDIDGGDSAPDMKQAGLCTVELVDHEEEDDEGNSSDDEYEAWVESSRVRVGSGVANAGKAPPSSGGRGGGRGGGRVVEQVGGASDEQARSRKVV